MAQHLKCATGGTSPTKPYPVRRRVEPTIEERLEAKAMQADREDLFSRQNLGQLTDMQIRKRLFSK